MEKATHNPEMVSYPACFVSIAVAINVVVTAFPFILSCVYLLLLVNLYTFYRKTCHYPDDAFVTRVYQYAMNHLLFETSSGK